MDQFLASLPKSVLAIGAIVIGFVILVMFNPPSTVCDAQLVLFRETEQAFLYSSKASGMDRPAQIKTMFDDCQVGNDPGGCFNLFKGLKKLSIDLRNIPHQCSEVASSEKEIKSWVFKSMELMVQIAWGEKGPNSFYDKQAWFDSSDLALFCGLKSNALQIFGEDAFAQWRTSTLQQLPLASKMDQDETWRKSLFSTPCDSYR